MTKWDVTNLHAAHTLRDLDMIPGGKPVKQESPPTPPTSNTTDEQSAENSS